MMKAAVKSKTKSSLALGEGSMRVSEHSGMQGPCPGAAMKIHSQVAPARQPAADLLTPLWHL